MTKYIIQSVIKRHLADGSIIIERKPLREFDTELTNVKGGVKTKEEVIEIFNDDVKVLLENGGYSSLQLKEEQTTWKGDKFFAPIKTAYKPKTVKEINEIAYLLEGITIKGEFYNVNSVVSLEEAKEEGTEASLGCHYIDDECAIFENYTFEELANRTDVGFFTTEVI